MNLSRLVRRAIEGWLPFGQCHCVLCNHDVWGFLPYGGGSKATPALMRELDVVGSDVDHFGCPRCTAHDRERHLFMYLEASGMLAQIRGKLVVHFAPETHLSECIIAAGPRQYVRCDLYPTSPEVESADLLALRFESESVDLLIANHVLEHVADDGKALSEIRRVLKMGGYAILQTPYSARLHRTWEDPGIASTQARLQAYGQEDHVRLYGRDILERIGSFGLQSKTQCHDDLLRGTDVRKFGVNPKEPFFLFQRAD